MKAILEFNMDDPDDVIRHRQIVDASTLYSLVWQWMEELRQDCKYDRVSAETQQGIVYSRGKFLDMLDECGVKQHFE